MARALALILVSLLVAAAPADAKRHKPCARKSSTTVASTRFVRVYEVPGGNGGNKLYGCLRSNDRRQLLTESYDDNYVLSGGYDRVKIAGRFVAWQFTATDISCKADCPPGYDPTTVDLTVRDLRRRKSVTVVGEVASDGVLALTKGGALAWTERTTSEVEVNAFDAAGRRTLDHGTTIAVSSLRLHGRTVSWTNAGERRTAILASRA
jgi:hypothetical protein